MGILSQGRRFFDSKNFNEISIIFSEGPAIFTAPCDGIFLRIHFQTTVWWLVLSFFAIMGSWCLRDLNNVIICESHFNAETQVRLDKPNICLSHPYILENNGERRYILNYRSIHWSLLLVAFFYYILLKISKMSENGKVKKCFEDSAGSEYRCDKREKDRMEKAAEYMVFHMNTHNALFLKYLMCHLIALLIDLFVFYFLNFIAQGTFFRYSIERFPSSRCFKEVDDISKRHYPLAWCEQLTNKREETFGCPLKVNIHYEVFFSALWVWFFVLTLITVVYIIYLFFFWLPWARLRILRISKLTTAKNKKDKTNNIGEFISECKIGDVYLLYRLRMYFRPTTYYELLTRIADPAIAFRECVEPRSKADKEWSNQV